MIEIENLTKYYGERKAVGPLSCSIQDGEIVGLLGLNGAGKTTTLRVLACDLLPSSGTVRVDGLDVVDRPHEVRGRIGYLPDTPPLYGEMTVREYLAFVARLRGLSRGDVDARVRDAIDVTELGRRADDVIASLSHGYKQRVGIAQAIVHGPRLLVLDEPITGLDPKQIVEMRKLLRSLGGKHTIVLSSHILSEISETCDRILVIADGRIADAGTEAELQAKLAGARRVVFTVRGDGDEAAAVLEGVDGVSRVERLDPSEPGERVATLAIDATSDVREAACAALIGAGLGLLEVRAERELESVFLRLAAGAPDGAAEAA
ncbi:MAG TPA: ABC transporter ATP-binding protein [Minicystis sp.]|nr:ABC transporter ATP-binding protein [Minicystis sp.]